MARKQKAQEAPATEGDFFVTYTGDQAAVLYMGRTFVRGVPVAVDEAELSRYRRPYFEVSRGDVHAG